MESPGSPPSPNTPGFLRLGSVTWEIGLLTQAKMGDSTGLGFLLAQLG